VVYLLWLFMYFHVDELLLLLFFFNLTQGGQIKNMKIVQLQWFLLIQTFIIDHLRSGIIIVG